AVLPETTEQVHRPLERVRLVQLESRHHVSGHHSLHCRCKKGCQTPFPAAVKKWCQTPFFVDVVSGSTAPVEKRCLTPFFDTFFRRHLRPTRCSPAAAGAIAPDHSAH